MASIMLFLPGFWNNFPKYPLNAFIKNQLNFGPGSWKDFTGLKIPTEGSSGNKLFHC